jgi:hypothetical protein
VNLGDVVEMRYEDSRVCDTWIGVAVERLNPRWIVRVLVLSDPLDEFGGEAFILSSFTKMTEWTVKRW